jgi:hypothetical protein
MILGFRQGAVSMLFIFWVSDKAPSPCCLFFGSQAKRIPMPSMILGIRRPRPFHAVYDFGIQATAPFPYCLRFQDSGDRALSMQFVVWYLGDRALSMLSMI